MEDEEEAAAEEGKEEETVGPQPLSQLITAFSRAASTQSSEILLQDSLYISYANIMGSVSLACISLSNIAFIIYTF